MSCVMATGAGNPEKYTPSSYASVGRACVIAMLDLRGQNCSSRVPKSKYKTLDRCAACYRTYYVTVCSLCPCSVISVLLCVCF